MSKIINKIKLILIFVVVQMQSDQQNKWPNMLLRCIVINKSDRSRFNNAAHCNEKKNTIALERMRIEITEC